jgi:hypothetical protein
MDSSKLCFLEEIRCSSAGFAKLVQSSVVCVLIAGIKGQIIRNRDRQIFDRTENESGESLGPLSWKI